MDVQQRPRASTSLRPPYSGRHPGPDLFASHYRICIQPYPPQQAMVPYSYFVAGRFDSRHADCVTEFGGCGMIPDPDNSESTQFRYDDGSISRRCVDIIWRFADAVYGMLIPSSRYYGRLRRFKSTCLSSFERWRSSCPWAKKGKLGFGPCLDVSVAFHAFHQKLR